METPETPAPKSTDSTTKLLRIVLAVVVGVLVIAGAGLAYAYSFTPQAIRNPQWAHYHFRLQIISGGQPVNFAGPQYQTAFNADICTAALTNQPIHFHDGVDQFAHIHWAHMTGGILLKDYGWNLIGGPDSLLGFKFHGASLPVAVPIHGHALPQPPAGAHYFVYTGVANNFHERSWNDFLTADLQQFFAGVPVLASDSEQKAAHLNEVIGNVVIFAQKDQPTTQQVRDRFEHLAPLPTSSCAG